jgi:transcriptional regulator CtsR
LENCIDGGLITQDAARIMAAAVSNTVMQNVPPQFKDSMRAAILKQMLLTQI